MKIARVNGPGYVKGANNSDVDELLCHGLIRRRGIGIFNRHSTASTDLGGKNKYSASKLFVGLEAADGQSLNRFMKIRRVVKRCRLRLVDFDFKAN